MLELVLIFLFIFIKWRVKKDIDEEFNLLEYTPDMILVQDVEDAVEEMEKYSFHAAMLIYTQIQSLLKENQTVIQFQMYGLGKIWDKNLQSNYTNGTFQLAVALKVVKKLKEKYPQISMTSQEPCHIPAEIEFLKNQGIHVFERRSFSPGHFLDTAKKSNVSKPAMIVYMIHFHYHDLEKFLEAHWNPKLLSQIIIIGNSYSDRWFCAKSYEIMKTLEYMKFCEIRTLPFEKPKFNMDPNITTPFSEWWPYSDHSSEFLAWKSLDGLTEVQMISLENAKKIVENLKYL